MAQMAHQIYAELVAGVLGQGPKALERLGAISQLKEPALPYTWLTYTDRLYLAAYTTPPSADTLFPYPDPPASRRSPSKRSHRAAEGPSAVLSERDRTPPCYFSIDDTLLYNAFHHDFGPLHIGHLYRFAVQFHDILGAPENKNRPVVFWSKADARSQLFKVAIVKTEILTRE
jgi:cell division cycle 14